MLTNATLPYIKILVDKGIEKAIRENAPIKSSLNTYKGEITHRTLAESFGISHKEIQPQPLINRTSQ